MTYPPLVCYSTEREYRSHFEREYCHVPICSFDDIYVRFNKRDFDHCFFESSRRDGVKDKFSRKRAERISWIKVALQDVNADLFVGWDKQRRRYDHGRRVALVVGDYVVVIRIVDSKNARFVTAFVADTQHSLDSIKGGPKWPHPNQIKNR